MLEIPETKFSREDSSFEKSSIFAFANKSWSNQRDQQTFFQFSMER